MLRTVALAASALIGALAGVTNLGLIPVAAAGTSACSHVGGNIQSGNICHVYTETPAYECDLRFGTDYPDDGPVLDYITRLRDDFVNKAQAPGAMNLPYQLMLDYVPYRSGEPTRRTAEYGQPWQGTESLVLRTYRNTDSPGITSYKSFTFDYRLNRPVTFSDLFAPGSNPMDKLYPLMKAQLERQFRYRGHKLTPEAGRNPANYQNFAITDDAVIFFFDTLQLFDQETGQFFAPIARSELPPLQI